MQKEREKQKINKDPEAHFCLGALSKLNPSPVEQKALKLLNTQKAHMLHHQCLFIQMPTVENTVLHSLASPLAIKVQREQTNFIPKRKKKLVFI